MFGKNETICFINLDLEDVELFEKIFSNYLYNMKLEPEKIVPVLKWWELLKNKCCKGEIGYRVKTRDD